MLLSRYVVLVKTEKYPDATLTDSGEPVDPACTFSRKQAISTRCEEITRKPSLNSGVPPSWIQAISQPGLSWDTNMSSCPTPMLPSSAIAELAVGRRVQSAVGKSPVI